jgi:hypothetical protein
MLSRYRIQFLFAIAAIFVFSSCSKTNTQGKLIPKDAAFVMHINGSSLNAKLPWEEIKNNALFQQMYADSSVPSFAKQVLDNPDNSGVDIKNDMIVYAQRDSLGGTVVFTGSIKDADKFRLFNLDMAKGGSETKDGDNSFISKSPVCVGWNKEKFIYVIDAPQMNNEVMMRRYTDDTTYTTSPTRDIMAACKNVFAMKEDNSLAKDEKFTELMKKEGDVHFWLNIEQLQKGASAMKNMDMPMMKIEKLYEGAVTTASLNFTNGQITADIKSYAGKDLSDLYKKYNGGSIDESMISRLPSKNVAAVFALNFKPQGIVELLKLIGMDGMANIGLAFMGFTLDDFVKANKGDIVIAVSDFKSVTDSMTLTLDGKEQKIAHTNIQPEVLFAASIGDKTSFNQLIKAGEKLGGEKDIKVPVAYNSNDKYFAIGNSKENVDKYLAGSSDNKFDFLKNMGNGPMAGYIDIQFILKAMENEVDKDSSDLEIYNASLKMWSNAYIKGGDYSDGGISQTIEVNLMDKNTNSLKQLNTYFGKIAQVMEAKKKTYGMIDLDEHQMPKADTTTVKRN